MTEIVSADRRSLFSPLLLSRTGLAYVCQGCDTAIPSTMEAPTAVCRCGNLSIDYLAGRIVAKNFQAFSLRETPTPATNEPLHN